jgi:hypothetical protein
VRAVGTVPEDRPEHESAQGRAGTDLDPEPGDDDRSGSAGGGAPWWEGRRVAIRPDVPGPSFDPESLVLIRSDEERMAAQAKINSSIDEMKDKSPEDRWPGWLWKRDDDLASKQKRLSDSTQSSKSQSA